jgi:hypothetical protein
MYPHERSLVKRLENQLFALVGINSDKDKKELKEALRKEQITWRSWWDGGSTEGPIANQWNVIGWPTIYVLDHQGVIRGKGLRGEELDKVVDELLKEMQKTKQEKSLTADNARKALIKLVDGDLKKEIEKGLNKDFGKPLLDLLTTDDAKKALKDEAPWFEPRNGLTFIGNWGVKLDECKFHAAVKTSGGFHIVWVIGKMELKESTWTASITGFEIGYTSKKLGLGT